MLFYMDAKKYNMEISKEKTKVDGDCDDPVQCKLKVERRIALECMITVFTNIADLI